MDVSIIIPSFNTKNLLDRCLQSIEKSLKRSNLKFEIIVVDNASKDGTRELLNNKYPRVKTIFNNTNIGYGKANNLAILKSLGKYVLLLNSDIIVLDTAIEKMVTFMHDHHHSFIGGKLLNENMTNQASCGPEYTLPVTFLMLFCKGDALGITRTSPEDVSSPYWVSGACLMGKKQSFVDVGLFDESIFMYMDEIDFLYRAHKKNYSVFFVPDARFIHTGAASSSSARTPVKNIYSGLMYYYKKYKPQWEVTVLSFLLRIKAGIAIIIGKIFGKPDIVQIYEESLTLV